MAINSTKEKFISHFGEMGSRWGINRTVGQIYALIFLSEKPLCADEIAEQLTFSRSNVGMSLKELQAWRLVKLVHIPGERREFFEAPKDVWEIFRNLVEERRRREVEPTLSMLREALLKNDATDDEQYALGRIQQMHDLIELTSAWFDDVEKLSPETLQTLMKMGSKVVKLIEFTDRLRFDGKSKN